MCLKCVLNTEKCELSINCGQKIFFLTPKIFLGHQKKEEGEIFLKFFFSKKCSLLCKYYLLFSIPHDFFYQKLTFYLFEKKTKKNLFWHPVGTFKKKKNFLFIFLYFGSLWVYTVNLGSICLCRPEIKIRRLRRFQNRRSQSPEGDIGNLTSNPVPR